MFKKIKQKYESVINRWLFSEEIKKYENQIESDIISRPQSRGISSHHSQDESKRLRLLYEEQINIIKAENHTQPPSEEDILRYHQYHVNMVENVNLIGETLGQEIPRYMPKTPLTEDEYRDMVSKDGWKGMRISCGIPTGDLNKPSKPWTLSDTEKKWSVDEDPEIHRKTKD